MCVQHDCYRVRNGMTLVLVYHIYEILVRFIISYQARSQAYASTQVLPHRFAKKKINQKLKKKRDKDSKVHPFTFNSNIWTRIRKTYQLEMQV